MVPAFLIELPGSTLAMIPALGPHASRTRRSALPEAGPRTHGSGNIRRIMDAGDPRRPDAARLVGRTRRRFLVVAASVSCVWALRLAGDAVLVAGGAFSDGITTRSNRRFFLGTPFFRALDAAAARTDPARLRDRIPRPDPGTRSLFRRGDPGPGQQPRREGRVRAGPSSSTAAWSGSCPMTRSPGTTWHAAMPSWG